MAGTILVTCGGGLGNRLRGLASAWELADARGARLLICWPLGGPRQTGTGDGFRCPLPALFEPPGTLVTVEQRDELLCKPHTHYGLDRQRRRETLVCGELTYFYCHGPIYNAGQSAAVLRRRLCRLVLSAETGRHFDALGVKLRPHGCYTGLLVRCHGTPRARRWGSESRFTAILRTTSGPVLLCCDDPAVTQRLRRQAVGPVVTADKPGRRNTEAELPAVVAEVFSLAAAIAFHGTPWCALTDLVKLLRVGTVLAAR